jgi:HPt (histidine-containing phosphotransfer) domain-containing protein
MKALAADIPPVDYAVLHEAAGGDRDVLRELALLYRDDAASQLAALDQAAAQRDVAGVARIAHGLKGSSSSIGARRAADAFRALEEMGRAGALAGLDAAVAHAREECERARHALEVLP